MSRTSKSFLFLLAAVSVASSGTAGQSTPLQIKVPGLASVYVRQAVLGAQQRLANQRCSAVLSDFTSTASGQSLAPALEAKGLTAAAYLGALRFVDGTEQRVCSTGQAFAGMVRAGDDVVYVCPSRFRDLVQRDSRMAEAVIIHEMLHTLGLGENPPSSTEITFRVLNRCMNGEVRTAAR